MSLELLVVLSVVLTVIGYVTLVAQREYEGSRMTLDAVKARTALRILREAGEDVYAQGEGASKRVFVDVPDRIVDSWVSGTSLRYRMNLGGSIQDVLEVAGVCVTGYLPEGGGGQWVRVRSSGGCVRYGESLLTVQPSRLSFRVYAGGVEEKILTVTSYSNDSMTVYAELESEIVDVLPESAVLPPYGWVNFTVTANPPAGEDPGYRYARLTVNGTETHYVDVSTYVLANTSLSIHPGEWNPTIGAGEPRSQPWVICNNGDDTVSDIVLSDSFGWAAYPGGDTVSLRSGECDTVESIVTVPADTPYGIYTGAFTAESGSLAAVAAVEITVVEGVNGTDIVILPREWNVTLWQGYSEVKKYTICNLGDTLFDDVALTTSGSADWMNFSLGRDIGLLDDGECVNNMGNLTVPESEAAGVYPGQITVSAGNQSSYSDVTVYVYRLLEVDVSNVSRCMGPMKETVNVNSVRRCVGG